MYWEASFEFRGASTLESILMFIRLERAISYFKGKSYVYFTYESGVLVQVVTPGL